MSFLGSTTMVGCTNRSVRSTFGTSAGPPTSTLPPCASRKAWTMRLAALTSQVGISGSLKGGNQKTQELKVIWDDLKMVWRWFLGNPPEILRRLFSLRKEPTWAEFLIKIIPALPPGWSCASSFVQHLPLHPTSPRSLVSTWPPPVVGELEGPKRCSKSEKNFAPVAW